MGSSMAEVRSEWINEFAFESSRSSTNLPEICSLGQIWTTVWLMWHQKAIVSIYKISRSSTLWPEICALGQIFSTL